MEGGRAGGKKREEKGRMKGEKEEGKRKKEEEENKEKKRRWRIKKSWGTC